MVWYGIACFGMLMVWYGTIRYDMIKGRCGMVYMVLYNALLYDISQHLRTGGCCVPLSINMPSDDVNRF